MKSYWPPSVAPYQELHDRYLYASEMARISGQYDAAALLSRRSQDLQAHINQWWGFVQTVNDLANHYSAILMAGRAK